MTSSIALRQLKRVPQLMTLAVGPGRPSMAVAAKTNKYLVGASTHPLGGEAGRHLAGGAVPDADFGNTADLLGLFGVENAPDDQENNNYLENFGNKLWRMTCCCP